MRIVHRYYNRYPHGSLEGYAANYAYRYIKRRIISVIVGITILIILGIIFSVFMLFIHSIPGRSGQAAVSSYAASSGKAALSQAVNLRRKKGIALAAESSASNKSKGSSGASQASGSIAGKGTADFDVKTMWVKKDMGDEIGTIKATSRWQKIHVYSSGDYSKCSNLKISVPSTGYLVIQVKNNGSAEPNNYVAVFAKGFKSSEYLTPAGWKTYIGVSKGICPLTTRCLGPQFDMKIKFVKVKEGKYGTTKSKAPVIKRHRTRKGIIITDKHRTHWYKVRHTNTRPIRITAKARSSSGGRGGIQVSLYQGGRLRGTNFTTRSRETLSFKVPPYRDARHLDKGTYYIKVESYFGGNGYYALKWK